MIFSLILLAAVAVLNLVAALGVRAEFLSLRTGSGWALPAVLYGAAAVSMLVAAVLRCRGATGGCRTALLVGVVLSMAGPLVYGAAVGEFHLSHHLVRLAILAVVGVVVWLL